MAINLFYCIIIKNINNQITFNIINFEDIKNI